MSGLVKKILLATLFVPALFLSSCGNHSVFIDHEAIIKENAEQMLQCIIDRDAERLLTFFSDDIQENRSEETLEEIEKLFEFIDGDIVSYTYNWGGAAGSTNDFQFYFYCYEPIFQRTETTTGKIYTIRFAYNYIWEEKPECEGLCKITAYPEEDGKNRDDGVTVGKYYELPSVLDE